MLRCLSIGTFGHDLGAPFLVKEWGRQMDLGLTGISDVVSEQMWSWGHEFKYHQSFISVKYLALGKGGLNNIFRGLRGLDRV